MSETHEHSRRRILKGAANLAGVTLASGLGSAAQAQKKSKESMKYQDKPSEGRQCSQCTQFVAPDSCSAVEGKVSPQGYCIAWQKK